MSVKYHINPETGRANQCKATVQSCKFAVDGQIPQHYETKIEAKQAYEKQGEKEFGVTNSLSKPKKEKIQKLPNTTPKTKIEHNETLDKYFTPRALQDSNNYDLLMEKQIEYSPTQGQVFDGIVDPLNEEYHHNKDTWTLVDEKKMIWKNVTESELYPENNSTETIEMDWESLVRDYGPFNYVETDTKLAGKDKGQGKLF